MKHILLLIFMSLSFIINAQEDNPFSILYKNMYYNAYIELTENEEKFTGNNFEDSYLNALGFLQSFIGKYDKAIEYYTIRNKKKGYIPDSLKQIDLTGYGIVQDDLNDLYTKYNVAMFNESHHISQHRAFIYSQLEILKSLGYNQLALETLNDKDSTLYIRKYPAKQTGYYTNDPVYGNVIRKALETGFTLIPYDSYDTDREKGQADNIFKQYDPAKGKLIVYGGYGHIAETGEYKMMGQHLKNMLEEDVLSISQFTHYHIKPVFPEDSIHDFFLQKDKYFQKNM